jgi:hypothetical protein
MIKAYTYLIGWKELDKWYYGVRFAKGCNPSEFWKEGGYFTSSKYVDKFREHHGDPDIIEIRNTFESIDKALHWENKVLKRMGVIKENDAKWLNQNDSIAISSTIISESNRNREVTKSHRLNNSNGIKDWWQKRKQNSGLFVGNRKGLVKVRNVETGEIHEMKKDSYNIYEWGGLNSKYVYCTPHGKFTGKSNTPKFYVDKVSYNSLIKMCIDNKKKIDWRRVNASKFLSKEDIGKTCEELGYYTIQYEG